MDVLYVLLGIAGFALCIIPLYRSRSAGPILLDVRSQDSTHVVIGILMSTTGLIYMLLASRYRFQGFFWLGYGASCMVAGQRRFQIREDGVFARRLYCWQNIQEYYLSPGGGLSLHLRDRGWTNAGGVPREYRQRARELLSSRVPAQHVIAGF